MGTLTGCCHNTDTNEKDTEGIARVKNATADPQGLSAQLGKMMAAAQLSLQLASLGYLSRKRTLYKSKNLLTNKYRTFSPEEFAEIQQNCESSYKERLGHPFQLLPIQTALVLRSYVPVILDNGLIYKGEWNAQGQRHGRGATISHGEFYHNGQYEYGTASGHGLKVYSDGSIYEGGFIEDEPSGLGQLLHCDGTLYRGLLKNAKMHGKGKEVYPDCGKYKGEFYQGQRSGQGTYYWADGAYYTGIFRNNEPNGRGKKVWRGDKVYEGDWVNGKMHGQGLFRWPDGREYRGNYENDLKQGFGVFSWGDGRIYQGNYRDGLQHGLGRLTYIKRGKLVTKEGEWAEGVNTHWITKL